MITNDVLNYFESLNNTQKFNWICNFMISTFHREYEERNTNFWYRNSDSNNYLYNDSRINFRKKVINTYKKPTQTKLHSLAADVYTFFNGDGAQDTHIFININCIYGYLYSYIGQEILENNNFTTRPTRTLKTKSSCIESAIISWLRINKDKEESEALSELKNLSLEFDNDYWTSKEQTYEAKEYVEPVIEREVPDLSNVSGAGKTKMEIYNEFIRGVQAGELPCIDTAIREMETADDYVADDMTKEDTFETEYEDKVSQLQLRSVPKYLHHPEFGVDYAQLTGDQFLALVGLGNEKEIFYTDWKNEQVKANFKVVEVAKFQYNVINSDDEKPLAFLDAYVENDELLYKLRYFDLDTECFFHKLYDMDIDIA